MDEVSPLQAARLTFQPALPIRLVDVNYVGLELGPPTRSVADAQQLSKRFPETFGRPEVELVPGTGEPCEKPLRVGVVLSGGQAPGGHNVIGGLFDALKQLHADSVLIGFLDGPGGIVEQRSLEITAALMERYRNLGGFDIIGSGRTKIETEGQLAASLETVKRLELDGLVVVGGDDSNTNAAVLAEFFLAKGSQTAVIGVPKTIDGDLKSAQVEISFGHDTACRVYSELIGNLMRDALSARKYYHFVRLMGRSASHIALECALQTHPNLTLIGEEVQAHGWTMRQLVAQIADVVCKRADRGKNFGVLLIPEGLIEFVPEMGALIEELNELMAKGVDPAKIEQELSHASADCFSLLPPAIREQLLLDRDPHGNVQVSRIETEKLLMQMVTSELERRKGQGTFRGKFSAVSHFFGYEGRSSLPSYFDLHYTYALGYAAALLAKNRLTGYMACVRGVCQPVKEWRAGGIPITMMMNIERRHGQDKPVIRKALVDLEGAPFRSLQSHRDSWAAEEQYRYPGPIQFAGPDEVVCQLPISLTLESQVRLQMSQASR